MRKKLIEVALPLDKINAESAREKSIRHGHPSTLHLWWARRPLAACRAVLFSSLIDDPGEPDAPPELLERIDRLPVPERLRPAWEDLPVEEQRRQRLFAFIEELVKWESTNDERVLSEARSLVRAATGGDPPPVLDPFCGGGSIPLEAQRLGLEAHGSDLNPVAVLITKALIEIPPRFADKPPVNPESRKGIGSEGNWRGARGLAEDVRYYGAWMRDEAKKRIGHLYPKGPDGETVIAWLWARTVRCPNPACGAQMPLVRSFWLSKKANKRAWVEPVVEGKKVRFEVKEGVGGPSIEGTVNRRGATCMVCGTAVPFNHVRSEGNAGYMSQQLMAVVAEGERGRKYLPATSEHVEVPEKARPEWRPEAELPHNPRDFKTPNYGMTTFADLFTSRQLVALNTFSDLVREARARVLRDALAAGLDDNGVPLNDGGTGVRAYADAVATYLTFAVDKMTDTNTNLCTWQIDPPRLRATFGRQALPMVWDFAEANVFGDAAGDYKRSIDSLCKVLERLLPDVGGVVWQLDATASANGTTPHLLSTDPPYYDNVGYADLSDFFYVWLRRSLGNVHPEIFGTLLVPKSQELVATPYRFGGSQQKAQTFFEEGLGQAFARMRERANPDYPITVYYAFKQAESEASEDGHGVMAVASTGWETMLEGLMEAGFQITGTWPMRTEMSTRNVGRGTNALASSVVMVCRPRPENAPIASRRDFQNALRRELPEALEVMIRENIAPVDLAQSAIGPGMAIYSRYSQVLENDGSPLRIRTALQLINAQLDAVLSEQEGDLDDDSRFCLSWYEQFGTNEGDYGLAETLSKAKNTSVRGLERSGVLVQRGGKVRLLKRSELPEDWDPQTDGRISAWESAQHLVRAVLEGEAPAAALVRKVGFERAEGARQLAYRLHQICDRKRWAEEAFAYNSLSQSWERVLELARREEEGALF